MGEHDQRPEGAPSDRTVFHVQGMDCPDCVRRIQEHLSRQQGVSEAVGNPVSRRLIVEFDPGRTGPDRLREAVGRIGYVALREEEAPEELPETWKGAAAVRTYVSAGLFGMGLLLLLGGGDLSLRLLPGAGILAGSDLLFLLSAVVGGWNFFPAGLRSARTLSLDMNFLMTVAIFGAVALGEHLEAAAIAFLFSTAELLESYSVERARRSIESLVDLSPERATVIRGGAEVTVPAAELERGERVLIRPGERVPADGEVEEGGSAVNESPITGESRPVEKGVGDEVFAGTINEFGFLRVRVTRRAEDSTLARIIHLVEEAESHKARSEKFVQRFARGYTPAVTAAAVLVAALPPLFFGAPAGEWIVRGLTLLVIACPCALVISTPVAVVSGITAAARNGVLIKGGDHLERLGEVRAVALDKTGTLTHGHPEVVSIVPLDGTGREELLRAAALVELRSEHPIGRAIVRHARRKGIHPEEERISGFESVAGQGVRARVDGRTLQVGRPELFGGLPPRVREIVERHRSRGSTVVAVGTSAEPAGLLVVGDRARAEAARAVEGLRALGIERIVMLTGDARRTAEAIGEELGVDEVRSELLPGQKVEEVRRLEREVGPVAMVGDGVNDSPALAAASVGIAMGAAGSDAAIETADVALMGDELRRLPYVVDLSQRGGRVIRQNIGASLAVKAALAVGVPFGVVSLILAVVVGDMGASLGVTANSLRLARLRP